MGKILKLDEGKRAKDKPDLKFPTSAELEKLATQSFGEARTNRDRLESLIKLFSTLIPIAEGAYRNRPTQGNCYALSNLVGQFRDIMGQFDETLDSSELADEILRSIFEPFVEDIIKTLGKVIRKSLGDLPRKSRQKVEPALKEVLLLFGRKVEMRLKDVKNSLPQAIEELVP